MASSSDTVYDLLGLGFGPANVAVAGALIEQWEADKTCPVKNVLFLEKHSQFRWHPGMLLPDARMQISFMKDLATLRSPRSPITFLSYLHSQNRLVNFINRGSTIPSRKEYADYLAWSAGYVQDHGINVRFGSEVLSLDDGGDGIIVARVRDLQSGEEFTYRTRDLIISPGGSPSIPPTLRAVYTSSQRVIHSSSYASLIPSVLSKVPRNKPLRIAVVGSGQSGAEVTMDLRERLSAIPGGNHQIDLILRKGSLKPSDDSPFANEIFDPDATDAWFSMPSSAVRASQLKEYRGTNYGVVNPRTIDAMYEVIYDQKVDESVRSRGAKKGGLPPQIAFRTYSDVISAEHISNAATLDSVLDGASDNISEDTVSEPITLIFRNIISSQISSQKYDAIVLATGYHRRAWIDYLKFGGLGKYYGLAPTTDPALCVLQPATSLGVEENASAQPSESGLSTPTSEASTAPTSPAASVARLPATGQTTMYVSRQYQLLPTEGETKSRIYLQGVEEASHGLSDTLLSVMGVRSGEVVKDLCAVRRAN